MSENIITVKDLRYRWNTNQPEVLHIPDWEVAKSHRVFIRGASGSGKSTLLSLLAGVILPQSGEINVLGRQVNHLSASRRDHFRADHIGFVFQLFNLIPYLSVIENVMIPCRFSKARRAKATQSDLTLEEEAMRLLDHLAMGDKKLIHRSVTDLSVGQQQRVATARALIGAPEIIIADEPTSSLDSDMRESFIELLFQECEDTDATLLFVSHDRQLESLFEHHITLDELNHLTKRRM